VPKYSETWDSNYWNIFFCAKICTLNYSGL